MKDEIKEILQLIGNCYYHGEINEDQHKKLCNYITSLQEENEKLKEENEEYKLRLCKSADFILPYRNGFNNWFEFLIEDKYKLLEILNGGKIKSKGEENEI